MDQQFNRSEKNLGTLLGMAVFVSVGVLFSQGLKPLVCEAQMQFVEFAKLSMIKEVSKETKSELCLNKVNVYFSEEIKGELSLCSVDSKVELNERPYAGAPLKGSKVYSGEFYLLFKGSKLNLGKMTFVDKMPHDGTLFVEQLNPDNNQDFIILFQYGSSNFEMTKFYGYDFANERLMQYNFKLKNGAISNEIYIGPGQDGDLDIEILPSKEFISKVYDNSIVKIRVTKWKFNSKENMFEEIDSQIQER